MKAELGTWPKDRQILHNILPIDTPLEIDFHITGVCNFKCNYCLWSMPKEELAKQVLASAPYMDFETFCIALEQLKEFPHKIKHLTLTGGEPLLHKRLPEMIRMVRDAEVAQTIQVISNASPLTRDLSRELVGAGLTELKISLQGLNEEAYRKTSSAKISWDKFYDNIRYFSEVRGDCKLKVKVADTALDSGDEKKFYELFGDICDAVAIENIYDAWAVNGMKHEHINAHKENRYGHAIDGLKVCKCVFIYFDILPNGMFATRCHRDLGFGNVHDTTLLKAWNCDAINKLREGFLRGTVRHPQCTVNSQTAHPEDVLDGYEAEILSRMERQI
jgi:sulfatase maturation enzyme AslB (radical SAM superfamily)